MNFLKSAVLTFFTNVVLMFTVVANTIITSRALGTEGKGVLAVSQNILSFSIIVFGLGLTASNIYFVGEDKENSRKITFINIVLPILSAAILIPLYFLNNKFRFGIFKGVDDVILVLVLITIPFLTLKTSLVTIVLGMQEVVEYNKLNMLDKVLTMVMLVIGVLAYRSPISVIITNLLSIIVVLFFTLKKINSKTQGEYSFDIKLFKRMLHYGIKAQIGNLVQLLNYRVNIFIINYFLVIDQVGIYSNAVALGETLWQVSGSIATIIFPMTSGSKDKEQLGSFINKVTRISFALIIIFSIFLALISDKVILIMFGEEFLKASEALLYLLPGISIFSISNILANYMAGIAKVQYNIYSSIISLVVTLVFNLLLVPRLGINGAAISTSLSYFVFTASSIYFYKNITKSRVRDIIILKKEDINDIIVFIKGKLLK
jgi:O-antigen/teichoic acid export membrane protein